RGGLHLEVQDTGAPQIVDLVAKERLLVSVEPGSSLATVERRGRAAHADVVSEPQPLGRLHERRRHRVVRDGRVRRVDVVLARPVVAHGARGDDDVPALDLRLERRRGSYADVGLTAEHRQLLPGRRSPVWWRHPMISFFTTMAGIPLLKVRTGTSCDTFSSAQ